MQVGKNNISQFLTTNNVCFVIPVYQRNYDWKEENCKQLWNDIWFISKTNATHFLGTICSSGTVAHEKTIIDGQQRITTITLLLKAIHDSSENEDFKKEIFEKYLANTGFGIPDNHRIKLQLNTRDDYIYNKLLGSRYHTESTDLDDKLSESRLYQNYAFFYNCIEKLSDDVKFDIVRALEKLIIVELDIENEDPQEIFESLNSTGLDLSDVDLIRNYLLMSLDRETQKRMYESYWYPIEENVGPDNMVRFFLDYYIYSRKSDTLTIRGRRSHISVGHLYEGYKEYYKERSGSDSIRGASPDVTEVLLKDMLKCSRVYKKLVFGKKVDMNNLDEMDRIIYSAIYINEAVSSRPAFMYIMEKYLDGKISESDALEMLNACLSMIFRSKVTKTNGMTGQFVGNMLLRLSENDTSDYVERFWKSITAGNGDFAFPSDSDFKYALFNRPTYDILRSRGTKYLLYSLERKTPSAKGLPRYDDPNITIEHIMPKTLTKEWSDYLGESADRHSDYLNKLGNLSLTNNNPEMSNDSFEEKKRWYSESSFYYTRKLSDLDEWSIDSIVKRSEFLTDICTEIWKYPLEYQQTLLEKKDECKQKKKKRPPFRFSMIGLSEGDEIQFVDDSSKTATVSDDTHVLFDGETYSLSKLAAKLKGKETNNLTGPLYFMYEGVTLGDLREEFESNVR